MAPIDSSAHMGKFYTFKTRRDCHDEGIRYWQPRGNAAGHMAVCLTEPDTQQVVTVVTITSKDYNQAWEFIPIFKTSLQKPFRGQYATQLQFEDYPSNSFSPVSSPIKSFLRLEPFETPLEMLKPVHPNEWIVMDCMYHEGEKSIYHGGVDEDSEWGKERLRPNMENRAEQLSLARPSLCFVVERMLDLFGYAFLDKWKPLCFEEVNVGAGGARMRLAERMRWTNTDLAPKFEALGGVWRKKREALLASMGIEEEDEDEEKKKAIEQASSSTMTPDEETDFLESMIS